MILKTAAKTGRWARGRDGNPAQFVDVLFSASAMSLSLSLSVFLLAFDARAAVRCSPRVQAARALAQSLKRPLVLLSEETGRAPRPGRLTSQAPRSSRHLITRCVARLSRSSSPASALGAARGALPRAPPPIGTLGAARRTSPPPPSGTTAETEPYRGPRWMMRSVGASAPRLARDAGRRDRRWDRRGVSPRRP